MDANVCIGSDVVTYVIPEDDMDMIVQYAKDAEVGGSSQIRTQQDRRANLKEDQIIGQICNFAGIMHFTGNKDLYIQIREKANANKFKGDDGEDIPGYKLDIKGSLMRASKNPLDYRLLVRPRERHQDWTYVLALVPSLDRPIKVHLVGWAKDEELPKVPAENGVFKGAYVMDAFELHLIQSLKQTMFGEAKEPAKALLLRYARAIVERNSTLAASLFKEVLGRMS